jgi:hypothetical protein
VALGKSTGSRNSRFHTPADRPERVYSGWRGEIMQYLLARRLRLSLARIASSVLMRGDRK